MGREHQGRDCQAPSQAPRKSTFSFVPNTVAPRTLIFSLLTLAVSPRVKEPTLFLKAKKERKTKPNLQVVFLWAYKKPLRGPMSRGQAMGWGLKIREEGVWVPRPLQQAVFQV